MLKVGVTKYSQHHMSVLGSGRKVGTVKGTDEKVLGGGSSLGYSFTMTNHWTHAIHKHAVAKTRLAGQGWGH